MAFTTLVVAFAFLAVCAEAGPPSRCTFGLGRNLAVPGKYYGLPAKPGQCLPCRGFGCGDCTDYKGCTGCAPGFGPSKIVKVCNKNNYCEERPVSCVPCPKGCGSCYKDAKKCESTAPKCPSTQIKAATDAKKIAWKGLLCPNPPGYDSTGYLGYDTYFVKDGICMDCTQRYRNPSKQRKSWYCNMLATAKNVAANAFKNCTPTFELKSTCQGPIRSYPFGTKRYEFDFEGKCGDQVLQVSVAGRYDISQDQSIINQLQLLVKRVPTSEWQWTVAPKPTKSGVCSYKSNQFSIRSVSCHRHQLVAASKCTSNVVRLVLIAAFGGYKEWNPIWKLSGTSDTFSAVRSARNCSTNTVLAAGEPRGTFLSLGSNPNAWQYKIVPVKSSNCHVVNLVAKGRSTKGRYLTATKDCTRFTWGIDGSSTAAQFVVEKRCDKKDIRYCPTMLTKLEE